MLTDVYVHTLYISAERSDEMFFYVYCDEMFFYVYSFMFTSVGLSTGRVVGISII
jgi:hypothetical protein